MPRPFGGAALTEAASKVRLWAKDQANISRAGIVAFRICLILRGRLLDVVDHDHFHWTFLRLQSEAELQLDSCENIGKSIRVSRGWRRHRAHRSAHSLRREGEREIIFRF